LITLQNPGRGKNHENVITGPEATAGFCEIIS